MVIQLLGAVTPLYFIGESHCLKYTDLFLREAADGSLWSTRVAFLAQTFARDYRDDQLPAEVQAVLVGSGLRTPEGRPAYREVSASAAFLSGLPVAPPICVLFAGDMDVHGLLAQIAQGYDFSLPDDPGYGDDLSRTPIDAALVQAQVDAFLRPFVSAAAELRRKLPRTFIHALPPRTSDDLRAARWTGGTPAPAALRAKLVLLANRRLAALGREFDVEVVGDCAELLRDGYVRPELDIDGVHLGREAALIGVRDLLSRAARASAGAWHPERYEQLAAQAPPRPQPLETDLDVAWRAQGFVHAAVADDVSAFLSGEAAPSARDRFDWCARPGSARAEVLTRSQVEALARLLSAEPAAGLLHAGSDRTLTVAGARRLLAAPGEALSSPVPAGCHRGWLALQETVLQAAGTDAGPVRLAAGSLFVFDPARVQVSLAADGQCEGVELTLTPRLRSAPFRVVSSTFDLPIDPFSYSVADTVAFPGFGNDRVHERAEAFSDEIGPG